MWFLLNNIPSGRHRDVNALVERFNARHASDMADMGDMPLAVFAPTVISMRRNADGSYVRHSIPLLFHYVFVKGELSKVKKLCSEPNGLSFVLQRSGDASRPAIVSDREIQAFSIIARSLAGKLPVILASDVELIDGDEVEVISGPFQGLGGIFHPRRGSNTGSLTVTSGAGLTALVTDIPVDMLKVVRFASGTRRPYDLIDAFTPRLLTALRPYGTGRLLDPLVLAPLVSFTRRLDQASIPNPKLNAKLQLHLLGAWTLLGDVERARRSRVLFEASSHQLTNPQSRVLADLITGVIDRDCTRLEQGERLLSTLKPTAMNNILRTEFEFWNQTSQAISYSV